METIRTEMLNYATEHGISKYLDAVSDVIENLKENDYEMEILVVLEMITTILDHGVEVLK